MWTRGRQVYPVTITTSKAPALSAPSQTIEAMKSVKRNSIVDKFVVSEDPLPKVPPEGARIKVCYAGACYVEGQVEKSGQRRPRLAGVRDTSLFPGFEVSGVVDEVGPSVNSSKIRPGDRVIVYPGGKDFADVGFAQFVTVKDPRDLIKIPESLPMEEAAILPTGALRSYSAVLRAKPFIEAKMNANTNSVTNVLIVGAGGMGLWTLKLAHHLLAGDRSRVHITVADTNIQKLMIAKDQGCYGVIHWNDAIHEEYILARTRDVCSGGVDIAIDFVSSVRTIGRIIKVLREEGVIIVGGNSQSQVTVDLTELSHKNQSILGVDSGTVEQLEALVQLVATGKVKPPIYTIYPVEEANNVFDLLSESKIDGRAILQVQGAPSRQKIATSN